ncbi:D-2-hydroxyacid dehydrogenase [Thiospirochaeta perfilievii]|uniref:D-2-hydroxyacid dehydrogenase n=1 Tax=Thiospirochaeta perfilievii TaxID=252967 RepID=A0A5C1Q936_9SPIO|nr:D-2-hydroxyacid dehydrogenase [Thiospirochaeta perfilievii]QEN03957.1 D-2-hydroxyacid dehydrogenase [Thiospirochaeta perfilievii]
MNLAILDAATLGMDLDLTPFNKFGDVTIYQSTSNQELVSHGYNADILILNKFVLGEEEFKKLPNLKLVCLTATGYNNIDVEKAKIYNIRVTNVEGYSTNSVAQHTFSMLLYQLQHLKYYDEYIKSGSYQGSKTFTHIERSWTEISGKTWGIIGLGNIGRSVAKIAKSFGANVIYTSTSGVKREEEYTEVTLKELLTKSDIISIHAPLNSKTDNLISIKEFLLVKKNLIILNLGRGGIINEKALAHAIDNGLISGACIDVLTSEPVKDDNPLVNLKNKDKLFITPHIAWASIEARNRVVSEICENITSFLNGEERNWV